MPPPVLQVVLPRPCAHQYDFFRVGSWPVGRPLNVVFVKMDDFLEIEAEYTTYSEEKT